MEENKCLIGGENAIILGNSPSSGSSLLASLISESGGVFQKGERNVFDKPKWVAEHGRRLKENWSLSVEKGYLRHFPCDHSGMFQKFGEIPNFSNSTLSYAQFVHQVMINEAAENGCDAYLEKTPNNAFALKFLHHALPQAKFVVIHRHPVSVFHSLRRRGFSAYASVCRWYFNNLSVLCLLGANRVKFVAYEELTKRPNEVLADLMDFLGRSFDEDVLLNRKASGLPQLKTWSKNISGKIEAENPDESMPEEMAAIFLQIQANQSFRDYLQLRDTPTPVALANLLGYNIETRSITKLPDPRLFFPYLSYWRYIGSCVMRRRRIMALWHEWKSFDG